MPGTVIVSPSSRTRVMPGIVSCAGPNTGTGERAIASDVIAVVVRNQM